MNIALFKGLDIYKVEMDVNDFITLPRVAVKDIQFSTAEVTIQFATTTVTEYGVEYSVMVVYEALADAEVE